MTHIATASRELAHRAHDGLEVTLLWDPRTNEVSVDVVDDRHDSTFSVTVDPAAALDAFNHPYAYAPAWVELNSTSAARATAVTEG
jgi:hypothetical protein